jgi:hypothetical protein
MATLQGKCELCAIAYLWKGPAPLVRDARCPKCDRPLKRTTHVIFHNPRYQKAALRFVEREFFGITSSVDPTLDQARRHGLTDGRNGRPNAYAYESNMRVFDAYIEGYNQGAKEGGFASITVLKPYRRKA